MICPPLSNTNQKLYEPKKQRSELQVQRQRGLILLATLGIDQHGLQNVFLTSLAHTEAVTVGVKLSLSYST